MKNFIEIEALEDTLKSGELTSYNTRGEKFLWHKNGKTVIFWQKNEFIEKLKKCTQGICVMNKFHLEFPRHAHSWSRSSAEDSLRSVEYRRRSTTNLLSEWQRQDSSICLSSVFLTNLSHRTGKQMVIDQQLQNKDLPTWVTNQLAYIFKLTSRYDGRQLRFNQIIN